MATAHGVTVAMSFRFLVRLIAGRGTAGERGVNPVPGSRFPAQPSDKSDYWFRM